MFLNLGCFVFAIIFIPLNKYDTRKNKETDNIFIYKIKGKQYESDNHTYLSSGKTKIFENKTDDILVMTLYNKRYLFIGYYPNTQQQKMMAIPYEIRALNKLDIIDLENISKRWTYKFSEITSTGHMKSFDPKNGNILYCKYLAAEKNNQ